MSLTSDRSNFKYVNGAGGRESLCKVPTSRMERQRGLRVELINTDLQTGDISHRGIYFV